MFNITKQAYHLLPPTINIFNSILSQIADFYETEFDIDREHVKQETFLAIINNYPFVLQLDEGKLRMYLDMRKKDVGLDELSTYKRKLVTLFDSYEKKLDLYINLEEKLKERRKESKIICNAPILSPTFVSEYHQYVKNILLPLIQEGLEKIKLIPILFYTNDHYHITLTLEQLNTIKVDFISQRDTVLAKFNSIIDELSLSLLSDTSEDFGAMELSQTASQIELSGKSEEQPEQRKSFKNSTTLMEASLSKWVDMTGTPLYAKASQREKNISLAALAQRISEKIDSITTLSQQYLSIASPQNESIKSEIITPKIQKANEALNNNNAGTTKLKEILDELQACEEFLKNIGSFSSVTTSSTKM